MYDSGKILAGIIIFILLITFPFWLNSIQGEYKGEPELVIDRSNGAQCVKSTDYMRNSHMTLLNEWRDEVVRNDNRFYTISSGERIEMSLSNTCMSCHANKEEFCDRCHDYSGVKPYCWDCHIEQKKLETN